MGAGQRKISLPDFCTPFFIVEFRCVMMKIILYILCVFILSAKLVFAIHLISEVTIVSPPNSSCTINDVIQGAEGGNYLWPTDGIKVKVQTQCVEEAIRVFLENKMIDQGYRGYLTQTDTQKVYINAPKVSIIENGVHVSILVSGWNRGSTWLGYTSKYYWDITITQRFLLALNDEGQLVMLLGAFTTESNADGVNGFLEDVFDAFAFLGVNFLGQAVNVFGILSGEFFIDIREQIIQSTIELIIYAKS